MRGRGHGTRLCQHTERLGSADRRGHRPGPGGRAHPVNVVNYPAPAYRTTEVVRGASGPVGASPWTPLTNPPPFGTPGTMLLESDGTVLVHNEPDNNTTGGTTDWWKLTPDSQGNYADGTWSQIASMPAGYTPLYFASAILPDGRMIVEGGEYIGENAVWSSEGAIYNPLTNTWKQVRTAAGLDEHQRRRERGAAGRHVHAPASVQHLSHKSGQHRRCRAAQPPDPDLAGNPGTGQERSQR